MAKLPPSFVKAPPAEPAAAPRRTRKPSIVAESPRDPRELLLRLEETELRALEEAREALRADGVDVSIEQMVHRVLVDWIRSRTAPQPAPRAEPVRTETVFDRLRAFAAAPLRTWRELGATLRRVSGLA